jgi:hypothetical protein
MSVLSVITLTQKNRHKVYGNSYFYLAETENDLLNTAEDSPIIIPNANELFIWEDGDLIQSEQKPSYSPDVPLTPSASVDFKTFAPSSSTIPDENTEDSDKPKPEAQDEEFERNFLRAVDRALNVVNKDQNNSTEPLDDVPTKTEESSLDLFQMTERALSSFNSSPLFTVKKNIVFLSN